MKRLPIICSITFLPFLISCGASTVKNTKTAASKADSTKTINETTFKREWKYEDREDKMTSKKMFVAVLPAVKELDLDFPYKGAQPYLGLIFKDEKNAAVLSVSTGQFMASSIEHQSIKVRFDTCKSESYVCLPPSDGDSKQLIIDESKKFIQKLKHSKSVIIEAEMYQNGLQQMEFNSQGLIWNH